MKEKLRVGLLLNSMEIYAWHYALIERIMKSRCAAIELLIVNDGGKGDGEHPIPKTRRGWRDTFSVAVKKVLLRGYHALFKEKACEPDAFAQRDLRALLPDVPLLEARPIRMKVSDHFRPDDIEAIKRYNLDVLIRVGFRVLRGDILSAAKFGVWSYHHGDNAVNRGGPAGFWETMERWPEMGSVLQILTEDLDNGKVLCRSYSCADMFFVNRNKNACYWKSLAFIPRKLEELYAMGGEAFLKKVDEENAHPSFYCNRLFKEPGNAELCGLIARNCAEKVRNKFRNTFYFSQWGLMFSFNKDISSAFWRFKEIIPPKDRFWADPHVIYRDGRYFIFIEEFPFRAGKGHISLIVMDRKGKYEGPVKVLERPYHLSYPFVFEDGGEYYMIPESAKAGAIQLYKCVAFPDKWEFRENLMEGVEAFDTTAIHANGRWWLFTNIAEIKGASSYDELFLFHSDRLCGGRWVPHAANPVVSDAKRARPAGRIFERNGRLYRPSQLCYGRYGRGINISEISRLGEREYKEEQVALIEPKWNKRSIATHTLSHEYGLTVIDVLNVRRR